MTRAHKTKAVRKAAPVPLRRDEPGPAVALVTLWGEARQATTTHVLFAVANSDQTKTLGVCGEHWIPKRWIYSEGRENGYDWVRLKLAHAEQLARSSTPCQ
jgi:hypothetical protein